MIDELDCRLRLMFSDGIKKMSNDYLLVLFAFCKYLPISCLHSMVQCSPGQAVIMKHNARRMGISVPRLRRSLDQWEMKTPSFGQDKTRRRSGDERT